MMIRYTVQAEAELLKARTFLEDQRVGMGDVFAEAIRSALAQIAAAPSAWPAVCAALPDSPVPLRGGVPGPAR